MNIIIYGATETGQRLYNNVKQDKSNHVVAFLDDNEAKWGQCYDGIMIRNPEDISVLMYDRVYIGVQTYHLEVLDKLLSLGVSRERIDESFVGIQTYARIECLKNVSKVIEEDQIAGSVAELGVFRGEFAKEINKCFPDRKFFLFDTFEGFSSVDADKESEKYSTQNKTGYFANTTVDIVMAKMEYPEKCVVKKGFFPKTTNGIDESFCFVNLDADLYSATFAGLEYFYPRMEVGGVIFVHDYFSTVFIGARDAVNSYCKEHRVQFVPMGDGLSIIIRKV